MIRKVLLMFLMMCSIAIMASGCRTVRSVIGAAKDVGGSALADIDSAVAGVQRHVGDDDREVQDD